MFNKKQRLSRDEISEILGKSYEKRNSQNFFVKVSPSLSDEGPKFSIIISKKVSKLAVRRHLLKRRVINIIQDILKNGSVGNNYIISLKSDVADIPASVLKEELVKIIN